MKFPLLEGENFLTLGKVSLDLRDRGLVLIQGENHDDTSADSNGSGKSSLADLLCWTLWGETARGASGDAVVNRTAGKDCFGRVMVEDGDELYEVVRYRKHKTGKNELHLFKLEDKDGVTEKINLTQGKIDLTQEKIRQILGCSYEVFVAAIYAGQDAMPDLPGMTDKKLKMLVEEAAGTDVLEKAYKEASGRLAKQKADTEAASRNRDDAERRLNDAKDHLVELKDMHESWEEGRRLKVADLTAQAKTKAGLAKSIKENIDLRDKPAVLKGIADCDAKIAGCAAEHKELRKHDEEVMKAQAELTAAETTLKSLAEQLVRERKVHDELDHKIGCPCSGCARPFTAEDIKPAKAAAAAAANDTLAKVRAAKSVVERAQKSLQSVTDARDAFRASMTDLSATSAERAKFQAQLDEIARLERDLALAVKETKRLAEEIKRVSAEENPYDIQIKKCEAQIESRTIDFAEREKVVRHEQEKLKVAEAIAKVFSPAGVRAHILDDVTPFLNDQTAKYLGTLSDGNIVATWNTLTKTAKGELREKFTIDVTHAEGGDSFGLVSGGEKRKVRVAAALALQDLVARRASKPIDLFIGDEIDDALDKAGLERLMVILEEKARERGSVFIISHNDLKDWVRNSITVVKKGKKSTVVETAE